MARTARFSRLVDGDQPGLRGGRARGSDHCASRTRTNRAGKGLTVAIGDMWHKTLVYFGMADGHEDDYPDDDFEDTGNNRTSHASSSSRSPAEDDLERDRKSV